LKDLRMANRVVLQTLDTRAVLLQALAMTRQSKSAFARAAGMTPRLLNRYLDPMGSQMTASKLHKTLEANGIAFGLSMQFADVAENQTLVDSSADQIDDLPSAIQVEKINRKKVARPQLLTN